MSPEEIKKIREELDTNFVWRGDSDEWRKELKTTIAALLDEVEKLQKANADLMEDNFGTSQAAAIEALKAKLKVAEDALGFYAGSEFVDVRNRYMVQDGMDSGHEEAEQDHGERAGEALKKIREA